MRNINRTLYLICYDIACPKRRYQVHKLLSGYKVGGQKSFFECLLTATELKDVRASLAALLNEKSDRAHIFQLDPRMQMEGLGLGKIAIPKNFFMIV